MKKVHFDYLKQPIDEFILLTSNICRMIEDLQNHKRFNSFYGIEGKRQDILTRFQFKAGENQQAQQTISVEFQLYCLKHTEI